MMALILNATSHQHFPATGPILLAIRPWCEVCVREGTIEGRRGLEACQERGSVHTAPDASADDACNFALVSVVAPHQEWIFPPSADVVAV